MARRVAFHPCSLLLAAFLSLAAGCTTDVWIDDWDGYIPSGECPAGALRAESCAFAHIQEAVEAARAAGGGDVCVPAGECTHDEPLKMGDGVSIFGEGEGVTVIVDAQMRIIPPFYGELNRPFRITGMSLLGESHLEIRWSRDFRVDHVTFEASANGGILSISESVSGVVDHCTLMGGSSISGVVASMGYEVEESDWAIAATPLMGQATAVFLEDNRFTGLSHALHSNGHAHVVMRYNEVMGSEGDAVVAQGPGSGPPCGSRLLEIYGNLFSDAYYPWKAMAIQGGAALIFSNTFRDYDNGIGLHLDTNAGDYPAWMRPHDIWIWDNSFINLGADHSDNCPGDWRTGNSHCNEVFIWDITSHPGLVSADEIQQDRDYHLRPLSLSEDGVDYEPYPYPHPFIVNGLPDY